MPEFDAASYTTLTDMTPPLLEQSLKGIAGIRIRPPRRPEDRPDRERLAARFEQFKWAA
jgi:hypothetical protein